VFANPTALNFVLRFTVLFGLLFAALEGSRGSHLETAVIDDLVLTPTAALINLLSPSEAVRVDGRSLTTAGSVLRITRGCEGTEMLLLLAAGILAFPATPRHRVRGFCIGIAIVYALTLLRLILLHFTLRYSPRAWDLLHGVVLPLGPVLLLALYFLHWSAQYATTVPPAHAA
jgi:exosortase family protein XrtM